MSDAVEARSQKGMPITYKILIGLALVFAVLIGAVAVQPDDLRVSRSVSIAAPPEVVFEHVNDFQKWKPWSPWEKLDPNIKQTYGEKTAGPGAVYSWAGNSDVGEGRTTITDSKPGEYVRIKLEMLKPFEDTNDVEFTFKPEGEQTVTTWTMNGKHNFISKAMCLVMNMDKMIGDQFEKGLADLKAVSEKKE